MGLQTMQLRPKPHTPPPLLPRQRRAFPDSLPADVASSPARCLVTDGQRDGRATRTASTHWSISALDDERVPTPATPFGSSPVHALSKEFGCDQPSVLLCLFQGGADRATRGRGRGCLRAPAAARRRPGQRSVSSARSLIILSAAAVVAVIFADLLAPTPVLVGVFALAIVCVAGAYLRGMQGGR